MRRDWDESELVALFDRCSNTGRWGSDDEFGTLNLITAAKRREAVALVREGRVVELGRTLVPGLPGIAGHPVVQRMLFDATRATSAIDLIEVTPHDPGVTHVDALCHVFWQGRAYNGRSQEDVCVRGGLTFGHLGAAPGVILTRGVLLDVATVRGVDWLNEADFVTADDLDAAERAGRARVTPGDAVVVHVGRDRRERSTGAATLPLRRAGLHADAVEWLHARDVAVYTGDCTERLPYPSTQVPFPLHQVGLVGMGLCMVDAVSTDELVSACAQQQRHEFLFTVSAPRVVGATGFPVNPACVF